MLGWKGHRFRKWRGQCLQFFLHTLKMFHFQEPHNGMTKSFLEKNVFYNSWHVFQHRKATVWRGKERKGQLKRTFLNSQGQHGVLTPISIKSLVVSEARHGRVEGENNSNSMKIKNQRFYVKRNNFFPRLLFEPE